MSLYGDYETGTNIRPANRTIAQHLGYRGKNPGERVNRLVGSLRAAGWLTVTQKIHSEPVVYRLSMPGPQVPGGMSQETDNIPTNSIDLDKGPSGPLDVEKYYKAGLKPASARNKNSNYVSIMPIDYDYGDVMEHPPQSEEAPF